MNDHDLFSSDSLDSKFMPLAAKIRPHVLADYVGQDHLVGEGKVLQNCVATGQLHSMILWGPPGTGKTTLAKILAQSAQAHFIELSAVTSGVKEIRSVIDQAKLYQSQGDKTVLFVDEVHRFNKAQQDAFLPHIENGLILFIGATTENPSFEVNHALLSRTRVHVLKKLNKTDLATVLNKGLSVYKNLKLTDKLKAQLIDSADGDARRLLNWLESLYQLVGSDEIKPEHLQQVMGSTIAHYDKKGDAFYDLISAFHKSVRGSDADAALYWMARIIDAGGDPLYVARRLLAIASEDIGNADPRALQVTLNAWDIYHRVGASEGNRAIAQAAVYCAVAPKSNAVYLAFKQAMQLASETSHFTVPEHLRNAPTKLMKDMGYGQDYQYPHDYPGAYVAEQTYLPDALVDQVSFYEPTDRGLEKQIKEKLARLKA